MCVLLPTANQSAFSGAVFSGLSDVHERSVGLQLALAAIGEISKMTGNSAHILSIEAEYFKTVFQYL